MLGSARPSYPPPINTVPLSNCLKDSVRPWTPTTGVTNFGMRAVIINIGARASMGTGSPSSDEIFPPQAPAQFTKFGASNVVSGVEMNHTLFFRVILVTSAPSTKLTPRLWHFKRNACVVRYGFAWPSPSTTIPPTQCGATAGRSSRNCA